MQVEDFEVLNQPVALHAKLNKCDAVLIMIDDVVENVIKIYTILLL